MGDDGHIAAVLAAGGSRRLGQPKQLLRRAGESLLCRSLRLAATTSPARLLLVLGAHAAACAAEARRAAIPAPPGFEPIDNPAWENGLSGSLRCIASHLDAAPGSLLLLGCDQPALEAAHLQQLLALAARAPSRCAATRHGSARGLPVVVPAGLLRHARGLRGDRGLRDVLAALPPGDLGVLDAPELQFDVDTPQDLHEARRRRWIDPA